MIKVAQERCSCRRAFNHSDQYRVQAILPRQRLSWFYTQSTPSLPGLHSMPLTKVSTYIVQNWYDDVRQGRIMELLNDDAQGIRIDDTLPIEVCIGA